MKTRSWRQTTYLNLPRQRNKNSCKKVLKIRQANLLLKLNQQPRVRRKLNLSSSNQARRKLSHPLNKQSSRAQATVPTKTTTMMEVMVKETVRIHPAVQVPVVSPKALPSSELFSSRVSSCETVGNNSCLASSEQISQLLKRLLC